MTLQQLHQVITIADSGSMNEAAKKLFISQPSLSATVKELEQEIGFNLFVRSNRGIIITPEGEGHKYPLSFPVCHTPSCMP